MPVKLIGHKVSYTGKTLWEIVGNLKNFGVGRLVYKSHFLNYPELSYYKIVKVQPVETPSNKYLNRKVMVWAEHVFRGKKYPELVCMHNGTYVPKFQLVPRSEEFRYLDAGLNDRISKIPDLSEWPPLMKIILERESGKKLGPLRTVLASYTNSIAVIEEENQVLKNKPPALYADATVAELTEKLQLLKAAQTSESTTS